LLPAAVTYGLTTPRALDQNSSHRFGRRGKKVRAILEGWRLIADEPQPGFVYKGGGLERLSCGFVGHPARSKSAQFVIDQRQELIGGSGIAALDGVEELGRVTH
jgi:hypothetical protein